MNKIKEIASVLLMWAIFLGIVALIIFFIKGGLAILPQIINVLNIIGGIAFLLCITILPILAIFRKTRAAAAIGYVISSYIFGLSTWILGFLITLSIWGWFGVIIGLFIMGVGVVPFGIVASAIHSQWSWVLNLVLSLILTFGVRFLGFWLAEKAESKYTQVDATVIENDQVIDAPEIIKAKSSKKTLTVAMVIVLIIGVVLFLQFHNNSTTKSALTDLNPQETSIITEVMSKQEPITDQDLNNLRESLKSYTSRTGNYLTSYDIDTLTKVTKLSNDYYYELAQSMLKSWDSKKYSTTSNFDNLYNLMMQDGGRDQNKLENDKNRIKLASQNSSVETDENGNQYILSRESISQNIRQISIGKDNTDKIISVMNEFVNK